MPQDPIGITPEFERGWTAALVAAQRWHEAQAKQMLILAKRGRFPKTLERDAAVHTRSAEIIGGLGPDDA